MSDPENTIVFQGVEGAHSDMACRQAYPYMHTQAVPAFEDVFEAVESGKAKYGMIPIENSRAGRVAEIHNLLPDTELHIVAEHFQRIEHHLLGVKGATLEQAKDVYSHPQALMQCREHIRELKLERHSFSNTAAAAEAVAKWNDPVKVAIGSKLAGEIYGLDVLKPHMEDADDNVTVFLTLSRDPVSPEGGVTLTSLLFTIRNIPSALYKGLGGFATNGVNILKLESYIPGGVSNRAQFFITFSGHPGERRVQLALEELGFFCKKVKVLGVFQEDPMRRELSKGQG